MGSYACRILRRKGARDVGKSDLTPLERALKRAWQCTACDRLPFFAALAVGLAAHMFAFANKLVNADEIESLFGKGATVTSGRWGLEAVKLIFPDYSMPWLYGVVSLVLLAVSVCLIVRLFEIKSPLMRVLLAGMIAAFPSQTGTFCFMFTSAPYALAFLFAVLAAYLTCRGGRWSFIAAAVLLTLSLGIYQAYIALTASLMLLYAVRLCLDGEQRFKSIARYLLRALAVLVAALAVYAAVTLAVFALTGAEFNDYVRTNANSAGILGRVRTAYDFFVYYFTYREYALITSELSRWAHIVLMALIAAGTVYAAAKKLRRGEAAEGALLFVLTALLPLAVNCMFLAMSKDSIHTLVIYSFIAVYILAAMLAEHLAGGASLWQRAARDAVYVILAVVLLGNVYFANEVYLEMYLEYENAYSFYSILLSRAENTEGFESGTKLALIGRQDNAVTTFDDKIDLGYITGPSRGLINAYSRENFIRRYLGSNVPLATAEECDALAATAEFADMVEYPYYGSIKMIDGYVVVKLG